MKCYKFICLTTVLFAMSTLAQAQSGPCTGSQYSTNAEFFRASASSQSGDATASKKKATITARTTITNQIKAKAEMAAKSQSKFSNEDSAQFLELVQMVMQQQGARLKVICENSQQTGGKYKTDVVVELAKAEVLAGIIAQVKGNEKLKAVFEEGKFKQAF